MNLGVVSYDHQQLRFVIDANYAHLYEWAKNIAGPKSKEKVEAAQRRREQFGASAEEAVFEFEKNRVGQQYASDVRYISKEFPYASYDIKSFTVTSAHTAERFIEVKAVSRRSFEFFWSAAELEAANLLGDKYYLYLLPSDGNSFDFSAMLVFENAYRTVYQNNSDWVIEENLVLCRKR